MPSTPDPIDYKSLMSPDLLKEAFVRFLNDELAPQDADVLHARLMNEEDLLRPIYDSAFELHLKRSILFSLLAEQIVEQEEEDKSSPSLRPAPSDSAGSNAWSKLQWIATIAASLMLAFLLGFHLRSNSQQEIAKKVGTPPLQKSENPVNVETRKEQEYASLAYYIKSGGDRPPGISIGDCPWGGIPVVRLPGSMRYGLLNQVNTLPFPESSQWSIESNKLLATYVERITSRSNFTAEQKEEILTRLKDSQRAWDAVAGEGIGEVNFQDEAYQNYYLPMLISKMDNAVLNMIEYMLDESSDESRSTARSEFFDVLGRVLVYENDIANDPALYVAVLISCIGIAETSDLRDRPDNYRILTNYDFAVSFLNASIRFAPRNSAFWDYLNKRHGEIADEFHGLLNNKIDWLELERGSEP